ncbi:MAG: low molecular weight phosphotyrosine protein phosphatase, partial [Muribaculaceae bacterium]|nr:low molecular weight phosphotyrosine protein phosphatase [Muribaculaceae bacterium]
MMEKYKILFVCLGNICRSPAAEGIFRDIVEKTGFSDRFEIDSAGTGRYHIGDLPDSRMRRQASLRGLTLDHRCRQVCDDDFTHFDMIIGMDES